jgi:myo-inositol-1(or 4)-monophosphatase
MAGSGLDARALAIAAIAHEAGQLAKRHFADPEASAAQIKGRQDVVTEADGAVERLIKARIAQAFPDDAVFGEESGGAFGERVWVVDPIDGTANFARKSPHFCVSIAYLEAGRIELGAIAAPVTDELFTARRGAGAFLNGVRMRVSGESDLNRAVVECGWSARRPNADYTRMVQRLLDAGGVFRRAGSGALGLAYVADGRLEGYCELHINSWDCLAGILMIEEAGGWVNDFLAGDGLRQGNAILGCTPALREALVRLTGITG